MLEANKTNLEIEFGRYKFEPLKWEIKNIENENVILVSKDIIESKKFSKYSRSWNFSEIRKWLNDTFYKEAFNDKEKECIEDYTHTEVEKDNYLETKIEITTTDKVFLLSKEEVEKYYKSKNDRIKKGTQIAIKDGLQVLDIKNKFKGYSIWYLRTPITREDLLIKEYYNIEEFVAVVLPNGLIDGCNPNEENIGIVPAIKVNKNKIKELLTLKKS